MKASSLNTSGQSCPAPKHYLKQAIGAAVGLATLCSGSVAVGATNTLNAGTSWNTGSNWSSGLVPGLTDALFYNSSIFAPPAISSLDGSFTSESLSFDTGTAVFAIDANAVGTTAQTLTLTGGTNALGGTSAIALSGTTTGTINIGSTAGVGVLTVALPSAATIDVANAAANLVFGANAMISGTTLTKTGNGKLTLSGTNSYTGLTQVLGGNLTLGAAAGGSVPGNLTASGGSSVILAAPNQIADTAAVTIGDLVNGANFRTGGNAETIGSLAITVPVGSVYGVGNAVTSVLSNINVTGLLSVTNGEHDFAGSGATVSAGTLNLTATTARNGANSAASTINVGSGGLSMTNSVINFGQSGGAFAATLNLGGNFTGSGTNSFTIFNSTGARAVDLQGATRTFDVVDGVTTVQAFLQNGGLNKIGAGKLTLSNVSSTFAGDISIAGGTLEIPGATYTTLSPLGTKAATYKTVSLTNGGTFRVASGTYNVNVPTATNVGAGQVFNIGTGGGTFEVGTGAGFTIDDGSGAGTAWTNAQLQGAGTLTKTGPGTLSLGAGSSNFGAFTGQILVNEGFLTSGGGTNMFGDVVAGTTIASGATLNVNGQNLGAEVVTVSGTGVNSLGGIVNNGASQLNALRFVNLAGPTSFGGTGRWDIRSNTTAALDMGGFALNKIGANQVSLVGVAITNPGNITVDAGIFGIETTTNFSGTANTLTLNTGTTFIQWNHTVTPTWNFAANGNVTWNPGSGTTNAWAGPVAINGGTLTFNPPVGVAETISGAITGNSSLIKSAAGTLTLSAVNSYTGYTNVTGGVLQFDSATAYSAPGGRSLYATGGTVAFNFTPTESLAGLLTAQVNGASNGTFAIPASGAATSVDLTAGAINLPNAFLSGMNGVTYTGVYSPNVAGSYRLGGGGVGTWTYAPNITGTANVTIGGGTLGAVALSGTNSFSGGITLASSTLQFSSLANLGTASTGVAGLTGTGGTLQWASGSTADISSMTGGVQLTAGTTTFDTNGNDVTLANPIGGYGAGALNKIGTGSLILNAANTYTGATTVTAGVVRVGTTNALKNSTVTVSVANGLAFSAGLGTANIGSLAGANNIALTDTSAGAVNLTAGFNNAATAYTGVMSGIGSLTKVGTGTLTLSTAQTYTGATTVTGANVAAGGGIFLDHNVTGAPVSQIISASSPLVFGSSTYGGGTLRIQGRSATPTTHTDNFASTTVNPGFSFLNFSQNSATAINSNLGAITRNPGGALDVFFPTAGTVSASGTLSNGVLGAWATSSTGGTGAGASNNLLTISGGNLVPYSAYTAVAAGVLGSNAANNVKVAATTAAPSFGAAAGDITDINTLTWSEITTARTITAGNATSVLRFGPVGGILVSGIANIKGLTIGGAANSGIITAGGATNTPGELIINTGVTANTTTALTINSKIADNGTGAVSLTKTGYSTLILSGTNTYTGGTNVVGGRIVTNAVTAALGTGTVTIRNGGQVYITGGNFTIPWNLAGNGTTESSAFGALRIDGTSTLSGPITLAADASIGTNNGVANGATLSGVISGPGALSRVGSGTVGFATLNVTNSGNTYSGGTNLSGGGVIRFANTGAAGTGMISIGAGSTLVPDFSGVQSFINSRVTPTSAGVIALTATNQAENIDFSAATGSNMPLATLGVVTGATVNFTGTYTPYGDTYRIAGNGGTFTFANANALTGDRSVVVGGVTGATFVFPSNNYTGGTTITGDTVQFSDLNAFGTGGITATGGQLRYAPSYAGADLSTRSLSLVSGSLQIDTNGNNITWANAVGNGGSATIQKNGTGTLILNGANAVPYGWTGGVSVQGGTLELNNAQASYPTAGAAIGNVAGAKLSLKFPTTFGSLSGGGTTGGVVELNGNSLTFGMTNVAQTYAGQILSTTSPATADLIKTGSAVQTLTPSAAYTYTGKTIINGGGILLDFSSANTSPQTNPFNVASSLNLAGGGISLTGKASTTNSQTFASTAIGAGANAITLTNNATANPLSLNLNAITRSTGGTLFVTNPVNGTLSATNGVATSTGNTDYTAGGGSNTILGGWAVVGTSWVSSTGGFIQPLATFSPTFTAGTDVDAPTGASVSGAVTINSLRFNVAGAATVDATGGLKIASGGILATSTAGAITFNNGTLTSGNGQDLIVHHTNAVTIASQIIGGSGMAFTKSGPGTLTLSNTTNNYGKTFINNGVLAVSANGQLGSGDIIISNNSGGAETRLEFTAGGMAAANDIYINSVHNAAGIGSLHYNGLAGQSVTLSGAINISQNSAGGGHIGSAQATGGFNFTGAINAPFGLTVQLRNGTHTLSGGGTYYALNIGEGTVNIGANDGLSTSAVVNIAASAAGSLNLNGFNQTLAGLTNGAFASSVNNPNGPTSTLTLNTPTGASYTNTSPITGNIGIAKSGTGKQTLGGNISTSGGVSVSGGQLILSGANTYTGGNSISGGTLQLGSATALGRYNNNLSMSGGTVDINGQGGLTVGRLSGTTGTITDNATSAGGSAFSTSSNLDSTFGGSIADGTFRRLSLQKDGSGTLTLTGTNTYTGSTLVSAGKLLVNGSLVSNLTTVANGAVLGGSGSLGAVSLNSGSSISPGNSPGLLTTNGNLTSTGGSFVMEIAGTTPVTQYDQLAVNGDIDLGSTSVLTLSFSAAPAVGDKFFLLLNNGTNPILGSFSGLNEGDQFTSSGYTFSAHYGADSSTGNLTGGNDFAIYTVVPEPSGMLMLLLTTSALTLRRRRRTA